MARWLAVLLLVAAGSACGREPEPTGAGPPSGAAAAGERGRPAAAPAVPLAAGASVERRIAGGGLHLYAIELAAGDYLRLVAEQRGADVVLTLRDPGGREVLVVDSPTGGRGPETVDAVAELAGVHRLEVRPWRREGSGRYALRVEAVRPAGERDRTRAVAARALSRAERLLAAGGDRSLRAALDAYRSAEAAFGSAGDAAQAAHAAGRLAEAHAALGELGEAIVADRRALATHRLLDDRLREAATLHRLGTAYSLLGRPRAALDLLGEALALRRRQGDPAATAHTLTAIGWVHYLEDDPGTALEVFERALALVREAGEPDGEAGILDRRGSTLWKLGRLEEARESYLGALAILRRREDRLGEAHTLANLGRLHLASGDPRAAVAALDPAIAVFREAGDRHAAAHALAESARAERRRGRLASAQRRVEEALATVEAIRADVGGPFRTEYSASRHEYQELYVDLLMERHRRRPAAGFDALALAAAERGRARALLDGLSEAEADRRSEIDPALVERRRRLKRLVNDRERRRLALAARDAAGAAELAAAERTLRGALGELDAVEAEIEAGVRAGPGAASPGAGAPPPWPRLAVDELRRRVLDPETVLLEYFLGAERSFLWVVGHDALASYELPPRAEIETLALRVHELFARSRERHVGEQARLAAGALGAMVLGPAAERLGGRRLLLVADGALLYVPFAALPVGGSGGEPLLRTHEVVHLPSATVLARLRERRAERPPPAGELAVLADPVFEPADPRLAGAGPPAAPTASATRSPPDRLSELERAARAAGVDRFARLPYSRREAEGILELVPPGRALAALGLDASRETVLSGRLRGYRRLHFATHGLLNTEHPELSGIVLSLVGPRGRRRDGFLRAHEVRDLELAADLVVLSACRTALGRAFHGEGMVGLADGFFEAGASRVVVSLWNVSDPATSELMVRLYRGILRDGLTPSRALREAQLALLRDERRRAPYYWAPFTLHGEWR